MRSLMSDFKHLCLNCILIGSSEFKDAPIMSHFLRFGNKGTKFLIVAAKRAKKNRPA